MKYLPTLAPADPAPPGGAPFKPLAIIAILSFVFLSMAAHVDAAAKEKSGKILIPKDVIKSGSLAANPALASAMSEWAQAVAEGNAVGSAKSSAGILEILGNLGSRNFIPAADLAIAVGERAIARFDSDGAIVAGQFAVQLAPDYPAGHFFLARAQFFKNKKDVNKIIPHFINGAKATVLNELEMANFISGIIKFFSLSLALAFVVVFFTLLVLHYNALFSDISSLVPGGADPSLRVPIGALAVATPFALGGFFFFALALPIFILPYLRKDEKILVAIFAILTLAAPVAFKQMAKSMIVRGDDTYRALYLLSLESWDYETKLSLENALAKKPDDGLFLFASGNLNKIAKEKDAAVAAFDELLKAEPANLKAMVNKGNTFFQDKDYEEAAKIYEQATKLNPASVEAFYNLSVAYTEMLQNEKSQRAYESALSLNQKLTNAYAAITVQNNEKPEKKVIDFLITPEDMTAFAARYKVDVEKLAGGLWGVYFGSFSLEMYKKFSVVYIALLFGVFLFWERGRIPHQTCVSCGVAFHPPMRLEMSAPKCNQCVAAQSSKTVVTSVRKDLKKRAIREFRDTMAHRAGLMDRVFPGVGRVYAHGPVSGMVFTALTTVLALFCGTMVYNDMIAASMPPVDAIKHNAPFLGAMALYWVVMNTAFHKEY